MSSTSELTSTRAPRVNAARRLVKRAFRDRDGRFLAEGPQACREAAAAPGVLLELFVTAEAAQRHPDVVAAARAAGAEILRASGEVVARSRGRSRRRAWSACAPASAPRSRTSWPPPPPS